ncbi:acyltransferase ChoActase/COT/CPT [Glomus cerebriforme]|uniref:Acyltransferase ChoActase/COT/CPT n=1 Tax=Glomus cerebriforme TaxID=658196 RepID=A0A397T2X1_9GLOM|nr:acyltransferase ChoActase/COT/CPT [Glomus cerebriforme]
MVENSDSTKHIKKTYQYQDKLPKLPIPPLEDTIKRYLSAVKPLQREKDHLQTIAATQRFMKEEGPLLQEKLQNYANDKSSYIEEFWYDSYLSYTDSVVLNLNPFFVLEDDPTPARNNQVVRAASLILSSLKFIHALRTENLEPDMFRGTPLCMSQFDRLFGTARLPSGNGCRMNTDHDSRHIVVLCRGQFYWFDVLKEYNEVGINEKELIANLKAIKLDASDLPIVEVAKNAVGVLSTENRKIWAELRDILEKSSENNKDALRVLDSALFVVCLDEVSPASSDELATNMLCGTYDIQQGVQCGTCANRWYDKLQIIVCENGSAGVNFEHTGVDGHTVLRFVSDIYTDTILRFARTINSHIPAFHSSLTTHHDKRSNGLASIDTTPKKLEWTLTPEIRIGIRFAETRLSDLILQNEVKVLEFDKYGKSFITHYKMSPDGFVQMAFQAAYYGLYGSIECTYEPAMTKSFLHGRTEAIRSVTTESVDFVRLWWTDAPGPEKLKALRAAIHSHVNLTKMCAKGLGQDRHLYALQCVWQREVGDSNDDEKVPVPAIFKDIGWQTLNSTVISTSNCGNPALRLFGFGPVVAEGFGIGYIIKDEGIAFCASSKHRQTRRFLQTLENYFNDVRVLLQSERRIADKSRNLPDEENISVHSGYGYFDAGGIDSLFEHRMEEKREGMKRVGKALKPVDYS